MAEQGTEVDKLFVSLGVDLSGLQRGVRKAKKALSDGLDISKEGRKAERALTSVEDELDDVAAEADHAADELNDVEQATEQAEQAARSYAATADRAQASTRRVGSAASSTATNLGFELTAAAQDAQFGMAGVANQIPLISEQFTRLRKQSGSTRGALRSLLSVFLGPTGLLAIGTLGLQALPSILEFFRGIGDAAALAESDLEALQQTADRAITGVDLPEIQQFTITDPEAAARSARALRRQNETILQQAEGLERLVELQERQRRAQDGLVPELFELSGEEVLELERLEERFAAFGNNLVQQAQQLRIGARAGAAVADQIDAALQERFGEDAVQQILANAVSGVEIQEEDIAAPPEVPIEVVTPTDQLIEQDAINLDAPLDLDALGELELRLQTIQRLQQDGILTGLEADRQRLEANRRALQRLQRQAAEGEDVDSATVDRLRARIEELEAQLEGVGQKAEDEISIGLVAATTAYETAMSQAIGRLAGEIENEFARAIIQAVLTATVSAAVDDFISTLKGDDGSLLDIGQGGSSSPTQGLAAFFGGSGGSGGASGASGAAGPLAALSIGSAIGQGAQQAGASPLVGGLAGGASSALIAAGLGLGPLGIIGLGLGGLLGGLFEEGGYTGDVGTSTPAGIVHGGEVVMEAPIVSGQERDWMALRSLAQQGVRVGDLLALNGYAEGGFVGGSVLGLASGGVVTGPTLAVVGEGREDEAVLPLSRLEGMMQQQGGADPALRSEVRALRSDVQRLAERPVTVQISRRASRDVVETGERERDKLKRR